MQDKPNHGMRGLPALAREKSKAVPEQIALRDAGRAATYHQLVGEMDAVAEKLTDEGLRPGDRMAVVCENSVDAALLVLAAQSLDAWPAIINARLPWREIEALVDLVDARLIAFALAGSEAAKTHLANSNARLIELPFSDMIAVGNLRSDSNPEPVRADPFEQCALLLFTSGTTGRPKAVMLSHGALTKMAEILARVRKISVGDMVSGVAPLSHVLGISLVASVIGAGAGLSLFPRLDPAELVKKIGNGEWTHLTGVPTLYVRLLDYVAANSVDVSQHRLVNIACGGAPLDPALKSRVEAFFGLPLVNAYSMTECLPICRASPRWDTPAQSVGTPEPGVAVRIVDASGADVSTGEIGELWARSPTAMMGYFRNEAATKAAMRDRDWIATGDLARVLPSGDYAIVGRAKEMIIRSGFNVYPAEVEAALNSHPNVVQAAVVGRQTADGNEEVIAFVQIRENGNSVVPELGQHVRERLAPYKVPSQIVLKDSFPLGPTGKVLKRTLLDGLN